MKPALRFHVGEGEVVFKFNFPLVVKEKAVNIARSNVVSGKHSLKCQV